jgi:septal ring factor EnvC (AmiA/AmiB activator)
MMKMPLEPPEPGQESRPKVARLEGAARRAAEFSVPQWISAFSSLVVASIAIWALLFSPASEALVRYLHSELTTRNLQIATLEAREQKLQLSVETHERELSLIEQKSSALVSELTSLTEQRDALQRQVAEIQSERNRLLTHIDEMGSNLSKTEFSLIKEKIRTQLSGVFVSTLPFANLGRTSQTARAKKLEICEEREMRIGTNRIK